MNGTVLIIFIIYNPVPEIMLFLKQGSSLHVTQKRHHFHWDSSKLCKREASSLTTAVPQSELYDHSSMIMI